MPHPRQASLCTHGACSIPKLLNNLLFTRRAFTLITMSTRTQIWLAVGFAVLITAVTIAATVLSKGQEGKDILTSTAPALTVDDWTQGNAQANVTVTEYGDM